MKANFESEINNIVAGKLTEEEVEQLSYFFKQAVSHAMDQDDDDFYKQIASEMTGNVKELALVLIDFRKEFKQKIRPHIEEIATKYIPQTSDQLEGIIETTEEAANTIMDNLDRMGNLVGESKNHLTLLKQIAEVTDGIDDAFLQEVTALEGGAEENMSLITDTFTQMSFQDLTGQRLQRIIKLVSEIEGKVTNMVISFGLKLSEREKNPEMSPDEIQKMVDEKAQALAGPQKKGGGLDQAGIDDLLNSL